MPVEANDNGYTVNECTRVTSKSKSLLSIDGSWCANVG